MTGRRCLTMEHSQNYDKVKSYYDRNLWSLKRVADAVAKGWITEAEYEMITGNPLAKAE